MLRGSLSCDGGGGREGLLACLRHFRRVIAWFTSNRLWPSNHVLHTHMHTRTLTRTYTHTLTLHTVCAITESQQELDTIMGAKRAFNLTWLTLGKQLDQEPISPLPHTLSRRIDRIRATSVRQCDDQVKHATTASGTQTHQINESGHCATLCTSLIPGWGRPETRAVTTCPAAPAKPMELKRKLKPKPVSDACGAT